MTLARLSHNVVGRDDAPWLLLGNSLGTTSQMWDPQVSTLAERFRVVRFDHRGHGGSDVPHGSYTIDDLGRDVLALADALGVEEFAYCGLSLGGMVGMWLAASAPQRVTRLAVCCTSAYLPPAEFWTTRARAARGAGTASIAPAVVARWFTPRFAEAQPHLVEQCVAMVSAVPDEGYAGCCEAIATMDLRRALGSVRAPTLVVAGANDVATPVEHAQRIVEGVRGARLEVVDDAAHLANLEHPEQVSHLLLDHLAR